MVKVRLKWAVEKIMSLSIVKINRIETRIIPHRCEREDRFLQTVHVADYNTHHYTPGDVYIYLIVYNTGLTTLTHAPSYLTRLVPVQGAL